MKPQLALNAALHCWFKLAPQQSRFDYNCTCSLWSLFVPFVCSLIRLIVASCQCSSSSFTYLLSLRYIYIPYSLEIMPHPPLLLVRFSFKYGGGGALVIYTCPFLDTVVCDKYSRLKSLATSQRNSGKPQLIYTYEYDYISRLSLPYLSVQAQ